MTDHKVYLSLGANLGDREHAISEAVRLIGELIGEVKRQSSLHETDPWGFESENSFLNAVVCCHTVLSPHQLLQYTQQIEQTLGRTSKTIDGKYHDRVIDIDILLYDDWVVDTPDLKIPHPLMLDRDFVMIPLREIKSDV